MSVQPLAYGDLALAALLLLIMFLIAGATGIGVTLAVYIAASRITDSRHRLRLDRLHRRAA